MSPLVIPLDLYDISYTRLTLETFGISATQPVLPGLDLRVLLVRMPAALCDTLFQVIPNDVHAFPGHTDENREQYILLQGSRAGMNFLVPALARLGLSHFSRLLGTLQLLTSRPERSAWLGRECVLSLQGRPLVMGILNVTPDSFSDGGRYFQQEKAVERGLDLARQGADILDIGGESTRPGSHQVGVVEEMTRVLPVIRSLKPELSIPISVDTRHAEVAAAALAEGAGFVNDVSGLGDPEMAQVVASAGAGLVLMHMRATPDVMQQNTHYSCLVGEIATSLVHSVDLALEAGIRPESLVLDPGIGFGKAPQDNLVLIRSVGAFGSMGLPVLIGASRKSFLERIFGWKPDQRVVGSLASAAAAVLAGARIIRCHDVWETRQLLDTLHAIQNAGQGTRDPEEGVGHPQQLPGEPSAQ